MKPSKIENILNYKPPLENTQPTLPLTYCQPFQLTFDPDFPIPPRPNPFPNPRNPPTDRPLHAPDGPGRCFCPLPSAPPPPPPPPTPSAWGDSDRRSLCNSTWLAAAPAAPRCPFPSLEKPQGSERISGRMGASSQLPPKHKVVFRAVRNCRPDAESSLQMGRSPGPVQKCDGNQYWPLMLSALERNVNRNASKAVSAGQSRPMVCNFCKNNKEVPDIYLNHYLYDPATKVLSCPVLRNHVCEICGKTGDQAHTLQYCPVNRERGLQAKVPVLLKTRTITNSTGKIRRN